MTEKKTMTADERKDIKELTALFRILPIAERQVVLNIGHDLLMLRRLGYECKPTTND